MELKKSDYEHRVNVLIYKETEDHGALRVGIDHLGQIVLDMWERNGLFPKIHVSTCTHSLGL